MKSKDALCLGVADVSRTAAAAASGLGAAFRPDNSALWGRVVPSPTYTILTGVTYTMTYTSSFTLGGETDHGKTQGIGRWKDADVDPRVPT